MRPAGVGRRTTAALVDLLVLVAVFTFAAVAFGGGSSADGSVRFELTGAPFVLYVLFAFAYYGLSEHAYGRTPGKAILSVRVLAEDGTPASGRQVAIRTVLRLIDGLPLFYLAGFLTMLATGERRARIGDLAAGTAVVEG